MFIRSRPAGCSDNAIKTELNIKDNKVVPKQTSALELLGLIENVSSAANRKQWQPVKRPNQGVLAPL